MLSSLNRFLDFSAEFLARRKGLLPTVGILMVLINFVLQFFPTAGWLVEANLFLHLGVILAILGIMLAWAL
jgi:hypothetical protein